MTSAEQPIEPVATAPLTVVPGGSLPERAGALLRVRSYQKLWRTQLLGAVGDRLALLVLVVLVVQVAVTGSSSAQIYRHALLGIAAVLAARLLASLVVGVLLLGPVHRLLDKADRRWSLFGTDVLAAVLIGVAPFWTVWVHSTAAIWLVVSAFVLGAAERIGAIAREAVAARLLPSSAPGVPVADQAPVLRHIDRRTGYAALPLAAAALAGFSLIENGLASGGDWLAHHVGTVSAFGAAGFLVAAAVLLYLEELPGVPAGSSAPRSPLAALRAPADVQSGGAASAQGPRGRTGSSVMFSFAVAGAVAAMASVVGVALPHAYDLAAGPVGFGLLVLAAGAMPALGAHLAASVLPVLGRRRLLPLALGTTALALLLAGLVPDFVLALVLVGVAGLAAGVAVRTGRVLLDLETEEARQPLVAEHLRSMVRVAAAAGLLAAPLLAAAFGRQTAGSVDFDHGGAGLSLAVVGLLLLVFAVVLFLRTDDRRATASLSRDVWDGLRGGPVTVPHRAGTGYFIALEGGDGSGKSTQAQALAEWIRSKGHEVVVTREPGGSAIGQRLRAMLLDVGNTGISHRAEALLYAADRAEHVDTVIRPALERGAVVITDRYLDSSVAYQGAGRDLAAAEVARISRWATDGLVPDLTVLLDLDPAVARERFTEALDRLESEPEDFHARVRAGFLALAAADPVRYLVVNAAQPPAAVSTAIRHRLDRELPLSGQERAARAEQERLAREAEERRLAEEARLKAEAEKAEREKQALLERLRLEEEEKEKARQAEEDRKAAEAARLAAEEARKQAEAEAARRAAEDAERRGAEARERRRVEAEAARLAELERQREVRRAEERRRAEDALRRAEEARLAAAEAREAETREIPLAEAAGAGSGAKPAATAGSGDATTRMPVVKGTTPGTATDEATAPEKAAPAAAQPVAAKPAAAKPAATKPAAVEPEEPTQVISEEERAEAVRRAEAIDAERAAAAAAEAAPPKPSTPPATPPTASASSTTASTSAADETTKLPRITDDPKPRRGRAAVKPAAPQDPASPDEPTAVLPQPEDPDRTRQLPRSWRAARPRSDESVQDKVPEWLFRPQDGGSPQPPVSPVERTRQLPVVDPDAPAPQHGRYDWAEDTPLDDLPSLTDELLGSRDEWSQWDGREAEGRPGGPEDGPGKGKG
ncbi:MULTISPECIES: dTMP kinase [Streptacidiphilus]|uniref:Thymidylate kinase n=1 Tax=Streptacidiphilus cavernicola TaxID=3342716 RepID=A0ABV6USY8_9ACTN|nr:dTMP kinase [Streptacidiphilus jeojiense]